MKRRHWFEFHDLDGCPAGVRDGLTDFMSWFARMSRVFRPVVPVLSRAIAESKAERIVDLCSGGGGPPLAVAREFRLSGQSFPAIVLTDKFPNLETWRNLEASSGGAVTYALESVDATNAPETLRGFRTLFGSFHHFDRDSARAILADAVKKREGIGIFEYTERNFLVWGMPLLLTPLFVLLATPLVRPFRWSRLFWTYLVPAVPFIALFDGFVSCMRTYTAAEMLQLAKEIDSENYIWEARRVHSFGAAHVTYLVGWPKEMP